MILVLPLAAALAVPAVAQQPSSDTQQPAGSAMQSSSQPTAADQNQDLSARQPLAPDVHQGFWGKLNPFARKKYVQRQLSPIRNRVNELDDLTAANSRQIKDVDARAQEGIRQASAKANEADQHALEAGNRAQQANQTATQASNRLNTVEQVVGSIDQYQPATQTEIRFRPGQSVLSTKAKQALDDMTADLKDLKGYIVEVQGFSPTRGQAGIQSSQAMANAVVRYLVEKNSVPVYRIFVMGMGNAQLANTDSGRSAHANRVEVSLLKNNLDQLASTNQPGSQMGQVNGSTGTGSYTGSRQPAYGQQPSNNGYVNSAPAGSHPSQPQQ
jgi:outer membrane protein OmpA-like peptidoglycan-associated protein